MFNYQLGINVGSKASISGVLKTLPENFLPDSMTANPES